MKSRVLIRRADRNDPRPAVRELMEGCRWRELIANQASVVIKPNLLHGAPGADSHGQHFDRRSPCRLRSSPGANVEHHDRRV